MQPIDKNGIMPIHEQIEQSILEEIRLGILKPGDMAYSEQAFAKEQQISRSTVRMVYDRLVSKNVLVRKPGKGTFVAFPTTTENINLLVGFNEKMRSIGEKPETKLLKMEIRTADEKTALALDLPIGAQIIEIRRLRLMHGCPFVLHYAVLPYNLCKAVLDYDLTNGSLTSFLKTTLGFHLQHAQETISAYPASTEDSQNLDVKVGFPVLHVEGLTFDTEGRRIRLSVARYRSDMIKLQTFHHATNGG